TRAGGGGGAGESPGPAAAIPGGLEGCPDGRGKGLDGETGAGRGRGGGSRRRVFLRPQRGGFQPAAGGQTRGRRDFHHRAETGGAGEQTAGGLRVGVERLAG